MRISFEKELRVKMRNTILSFTNILLHRPGRILCITTLCCSAGSRKSKSDVTGGVVLVSKKGALMGGKTWRILFFASDFRSLCRSTECATPGSHLPTQETNEQTRIVVICVFSFLLNVIVIKKAISLVSRIRFVSQRGLFCHLDAM